MEIIYTIHNNFDHCYAEFLGKKMSYYQLKDLLKERGKKYINNNKVKPKSHSLEISFDNDDFNKSNLSDDEIEEYLILKRKSKAKSWLSSQRNLRRKGKLSSNHIKILNKLGMLWEPNKDPWEKKYSLFKKKIFSSFLEQIVKKEPWSSEKKLKQITEIEDWINEQRILHSENKLSSENLIRLNAINFPFNLSEDEKKEIKLLSLAKMVSYINDLRGTLSYYGIKDFAKHYYVKEKVYVGSPIKVSEKNIQKRETKELEDDKAQDDKHLISRISFEKENLLAQENAIKILKKKPTKVFLNQIDKISEKYIPSWNDKNIYEVGKKGKDRLSLLYFDRYESKYENLKDYLDNNFNFPRTTINNVVYKATYGKFNYDDDVKIYAAKKMIEILDKHLLKTGNLNHRKSFKPISYLIRYYQKEKNIKELLALKELIKNHQILTLIYSDRLNKILNKYV
mgnify:FL=1